MRRQKKLDKKKKKKSVLEATVMSIVEESLKMALDQALAQILKEWK